MLKKLSLSALILFSLSACTAVSVHEPIDCPGVPNHGVTFTEDEKQSITRKVLDKFEKITLTYKARINAQCELMRTHDELHEPI